MYWVFSAKQILKGYSNHSLFPINHDNLDTDSACFYSPFKSEVLLPGNRTTQAGNVQIPQQLGGVKDGETGGGELGGRQQSVEKKKGGVRDKWRDLG